MGRITARAAPPEVSVDAALEALTERQKAFALAMVTGANSAREAAEIAGYSTPESVGPALMRNERVLRAVQALVLARTAELAAMAPRVLAELMTSQRVSARVRADIANAALDRVGIRAPERIEVGGAASITINLSEDG